jgi:capsule polysaccharide export protein KpsE/RkpR
MKWKHLTTIATKTQLPTTLPPAEREAMRRPLATRRETLKSERNTALKEHAAQMTAIKGRYEAERQTLEAEKQQVSADADRLVAEALEEFDEVRIDHDLDVLHHRFTQTHDSLLDTLVECKKAQAKRTQRVQALENELESYKWLTFKRYVLSVYASE